MSQSSSALDAQALREDFPVLEREVADGVPLVYLDNAATTQTPRQVVESIVDYYYNYNANVHRGIHQLSQEASEAYEDAHDRIAEFVGASGGREELVFTKNTTESENLVAYSWGLNELDPGDEVVLTQMEHHASLVTWQQIAKKTGATVRYIPIDDDQTLDMEAAKDVINEDTALVSVVHVSNVLGAVNPVSELADLAHEQDAYIFVDGAQAVPNRPVDVEAIDADFYAFSAHKMAGPTGVGALYGKHHILEEMEPFVYGGEMINRVTYEDATWADVPWKFEAGTPVISEGIAFAAAADYLDDIGLERINDHEHRITQYAYERLDEYDDIDVYGPPLGEERGGLVSFNVEGIHAHDLSSILNDHGVAIRAGDHCTQPLHQTLDIAASVRASFYLYNTKEEVDVLLDGIDDAIDIFA